jgi:UDP-N-acetylmuramoyl-L-alanyl-D-glutamate--2,6-diaminopimelate ligase
LKIQEIIENIEFNAVINPKELDVTSVHYNSIECVSNSMFVAIQGMNTDGNKYIPDAIKRGAKVIVSSNSELEYIDGITYLLVKDTRLALANVSHLFYNNPADELICIGITGTNGKTTTTALVKSILEADNKKVGVIGTTGIFYNDKVIETTHTTPESLELAQILREMVDNDVEYLVMEVSSHSIVQHRIAGINFKIAAFTNLTHEHLDFHKTINEYANAKKMLFDGLAQDSIAVINADDKWGEYMVKYCKGSIKFVGEKYFSADYKISNVNIERTKSSFSLNNNSINTDVINTKMTAYFNIQNAALSYAICNELEIDKKSIIKGLAISGATGRLQSVILNNGATAYVDYAHTPDALEKALLACKELVKDGSLICVFGCGGDRDKTKRSIMGGLAEKIADISVITDDNPRTEDSQAIIEDILLGIIDKNKVKVIVNRSEAIRYVVNISNSNDIILIAGKGHENYQIIGKEKYHFSDLEELMRTNIK